MGTAKEKIIVREFPLAPKKEEPQVLDYRECFDFPIEEGQLEGEFLLLWDSIYGPKDKRRGKENGQSLASEIKNQGVNATTTTKRHEEQGKKQSMQQLGQKRVFNVEEEEEEELQLNKKKKKVEGEAHKVVQTRIGRFMQKSGGSTTTQAPPPLNQSQQSSKSKSHSNTPQQQSATFSTIAPGNSFSLISFQF